MPSYKEESFLVVHPGSCHTLFSLGVRDSLSPPQFRIPSVVYRDTVGEFSVLACEGSEPVYPIVAQRIVHVDAFNYLLKVILQSILSSNPLLTIAQVPLLIVCPANAWLRVSLEIVTKYVFEVLEFSAFNTIDAAVAATIAVGAGPSALVINVGKDSFLATPVVASRSIRSATITAKGDGGDALLQCIKRLLPRLTLPQIEAFKALGIYQVLSHRHAGFYSMADLADPVANEESEDVDDDFNVARLVAESGDSAAAIAAAVDDAAHHAKPNHELEQNSFVYEGTRISIGKERFQGTDELVDTWARAAYTALSRIPNMDRRQECYENVVCVGGTFHVPGLKEALVARMTSLYVSGHAIAAATGAKSSAQQAQRAIAAYQLTDDAMPDTGLATGQVPTAVRLAKFPDYFSEWKKPKHCGGLWNEAYFLGAEIYAKQIFTNANHGRELFVDSDMYREKGPQSVWAVAM